MPVSEHPYRASPPRPVATDAGATPLDRCPACDRVVFTAKLDTPSGGGDVVLDLHARVIAKYGTRWSRDGYAHVVHADVCRGAPGAAAGGAGAGASASVGTGEEGSP